MQLDSSKKFFVEDKNFLVLVENFFLLDTKRADTTKKTYAVYLYEFAKFMDYVLPISIEQIEYYIAQKAKLSKRSFNMAVCAIRAFYNWLELRGYANLAKPLRMTRVINYDQRVLSRSEYDLICGLIIGDRLDVFKFLCNSGLRADEFLRLSELSFTNGFMRFVGKGGKIRSVPLNNTIAEIVGRRPHLEFFKSRNYFWLYRLCKAIARDCNVPVFTPHACRHYFATELHHRKVPIQTISKLLGHSTTRVTEMIYVHWNEEDLIGSTNVLD